MIFNSWEFIAFFAIVAVLYFCSAYRWRWAVLLVASYFFYMCSVPAYALLLLASTIVDYCAALAMARTQSRRLRLGCLAASLSMNLGMLFLFKYFNFSPRRWNRCWAG